jgi:hypothetical protein
LRSNDPAGELGHRFPSLPGRYDIAAGTSASLFPGAIYDDRSSFAG